MTSVRRLAWLWFIVLPAACFDSDERFSLVETTTGAGSTTTSSPTTTGLASTSPGSTSTGAPDVTCRDAIDCIFQCAAFIQVQLQVDPMYEPDLSCFLDCEEELTVPEAVKLLRLGNCTSMVCADMGECQSGGSSSSGGSDTGTSTGGGGGGDGSLLDPCINCIFVRMIDPQSPGCEEFAMSCE